ncbi:MAG: MFS transporter [Phycisphaerales bacterium]|nr:MAG: MFS transporter [Phycisphaerales bacterium]
MDWQLYIKLSALMFLEFAVWGAWYPVFAARLLGPLKMSGKQTGWIYAALPMACIVMPLVAGQIADQWVNTEIILTAAHLTGALLLFIAAWKDKFGSLFVVILLYSLCYAATIPLVNALMFYHLRANDVDLGKSTYIFMWAPIAWALAGYFLTGWRWVFKTGKEGRDCLVLAAVLSAAMAVTCSLMPNTPPEKTGDVPILKALDMLGRSDFLVFIVISIVAAGMMQFYFLGTAQFMQDNGIAAKNVPASMAIAQAVQAIATLFVLGWLVEKSGYKWTLTIGAVSWLTLYILYVAPRPRWVIVATQSFHGLAYVFFIIAGQMFGASEAPEGTGASVQALVITAQSGIGLFLGTQLAGVVMDRFRAEGVFEWKKVFSVPLAIMAACVLALALLL